jgi:hypothetical protein
VSIHDRSSIYRLRFSVGVLGGASRMLSSSVSERHATEKAEHHLIGDIKKHHAVVGLR